MQIPYPRSITATTLRKTLFILVIFSITLAPLAPARADFLQNIGDFLSLGANTVRELQKLIPQLGGEVRATVQALIDEINGLVDKLSETYQENLNVTLTSLDAFTRNKLLEVERQIDLINKAVQEDITLASKAAQDVIRSAKDQIAQLAADLETNLKNVIIVGGETAVFVIDRAFSDTIVVIALILLGIGLLVFVWSLFRQKLPEAGLSRTLLLLFMLGFVLIFAGVAFVPNVRTFVMTNTGLGLKQKLEKDQLVGQPRLLRVVPDTITISQATELQVWGASLLPQNKQPTVKIGTRDVPIAASSDDQIVLDVSGLNSETSDGSREVTLTYEGGIVLRGVIRLIKLTPTAVPPDLTISGFSISPSSPFEHDNVTASITVRNLGGPARSSVLQWLPCADLTSVPKQTVPALAAGKSKTFTLNASYPNARQCDSVAIADVNSEVQESNEANNSTSRRVTIRQLPTATPVPPSNKFTVTIRTGDVGNAGTDADVFITLFGSRGSSSETFLDTPGHDDFERNHTEIFSITTGSNIGNLVRIRLRHDNSGSASGWFVESVTVRNVDTGQVWQFNLHRWWATDEDDHSIDRFLTPN